MGLTVEHTNDEFNQMAVETQEMEEEADRQNRLRDWLCCCTLSRSAGPVHA